MCWIEKKTAGGSTSSLQPQSPTIQTLIFYCVAFLQSCHDGSQKGIRLPATDHSRWRAFTAVWWWLVFISFMQRPWFRLTGEEFDVRYGPALLELAVLVLTYLVFAFVLVYVLIFLFYWTRPNRKLWLIFCKNQQEASTSSTKRVSITQIYLISQLVKILYF